MKRDSTMARSRREHARVWEILPWYVNGTLDPVEQERVATHLRDCPLCRAEAEEQVALQTKLRAAEPPAPSPHPAQLVRLRERIAAAESQGSGGQRWWNGSLGVRFFAPRVLRWALAAQAAVLIVFALLLLHPRPADGPSYRTLSDGMTPPPPAVAQIRVVFSEQATEAEIRRLILTVHGQIASGPSSLGAYTINVPRGGPDPLPILLDHLRAQPRVRFAEPVAGAVRTEPF